MNEQQVKQLNREEKSRTEYSARNTTVAMMARIIAILLGFCTRVVFTHTLSEEYVGINGLFTDILNVLALSELPRRCPFQRTPLFYRDSFLLFCEHFYPRLAPGFSS